MESDKDNEITVRDSNVSKFSLDEFMIFVDRMHDKNPDMTVDEFKEELQRVKFIQDSSDKLKELESRWITRRKRRTVIALFTILFAMLGLIIAFM